MQGLIDYIKGIILILYQFSEKLGFPSYALAIILIATIVKLLLFPLTLKQMKSMMGTQEIQPEMMALREKYKNNPEKLNAEMTRLYQEHNVNPMAGCLPMLIQMPILYGLFLAMRQYQFEPIEHATFLWVPNLNNPDPLYILPVLVGVGMFFQQKLAMPQDTGTAENPMMKSMLYFMPPMMAYITVKFPSGLALYWFSSTVLSIFQQMILNKQRAKEKIRLQEKRAQEKQEREEKIAEQKLRGQNPAKKKKKKPAPKAEYIPQNKPEDRE